MGRTGLLVGFNLAMRLALAVPGAVLVVALLAAPSPAVEFQQFTSYLNAGDGSPCWSRDSQRIFYSSRSAGFTYIFFKAKDAPMSDQGTRLTSWFNEETAVAISPDDRWAMLAVEDTLGFTRLWRCPADGGDPLTRVTAGPF